METIELEELAADLDRLIDAFGFGGEFSKQDLYDYFKSQDVMESKISQLIENELIEQNQLTGSYYFSNIVTCNIFLKKYKGESEEKPKKEKLEKIESKGNEYKVNIELNASKKEYENKLGI